MAHPPPGPYPPPGAPPGPYDPPGPRPGPNDPPPQLPPPPPKRCTYRHGGQEVTVEYRRRQPRPAPRVAESEMFPGMVSWQPEERVVRILNQNTATSIYA